MSKLERASEWNSGEALSAIDGDVLEALRQQEVEIARRYQGGPRWPYVAIAIVCFAVWLSFMPLAILGILPLWLGCALGSVFVAGGFVVAHEAMHSNIGQEGTRAHFWNELTGQIASVPLFVPYSMLRTMHLQHHRHTNDPDRDPDAIHAAPNLGTALVRSWINRQPGARGTGARWRRHVAELGTPEAKRALTETIIVQVAALALFSAFAWSGHAIEVALLWWVPRHIGMTYTQIALSWAPHHPHGKTGRYENTGIIRHPLGYVGSMGIEYHLIHHLYPYVPVHAMRSAYREMKPILEARGVDCSAH